MEHYAAKRGEVHRPRWTVTMTNRKKKWSAAGLLLTGVILVTVHTQRWRAIVHQPRLYSFALRQAAQDATGVGDFLHRARLHTQAFWQCVDIRYDPRDKFWSGLPRYRTPHSAEECPADTNVEVNITIE